MGLKIIWGDITKERTEALVTLASSEPRVGSGVDRSVHAAAGEKLLNARLKQNASITLGQVVCTDSYGLKKTSGAKKVIHVCSVFWEGGERTEEALLNAVYLKAAACAHREGCHTVSFPLIGAGKYGMPKEKALDCAIQSLEECAGYFPELELKLVILESPVYFDAQNRYPQICESHFTKEEEAKVLAKFPLPRAYSREELAERAFLNTNAGKYWQDVTLRQLRAIGDLRDVLKFAWNYVKNRDKSLRDLIKLECSGSQDFARRAKLYGRFLLTNKDLAEASQIPVRRLKNIFTGSIDRPTREDVLALCVALKVPAKFVSVMLAKGRRAVVDSKTKERDRYVLSFMRMGGVEVRVLNQELAAHQLGLLQEPLLSPPHSGKRKGGCKASAGTCQAAKRDSISFLYD